MKLGELRDAIHYGAIDSLIIYGHAGAWRVYASGDLGWKRQWLETKGGEDRVFASLDTAHGVVRDLAFRGLVQIESVPAGDSPRTSAAH